VSTQSDSSARPDADSRNGQQVDDAAAFLERAVYGVYRSTADGRFLYVNDALVRMLGYDAPQELYALHIPTQVYSEASEREVLLRRDREGRVGRWSQVRWKTRNGSTLVVRLAVNTVSDGDGRVRFFEGIVEDVTESLRREEILRRSERMSSLGTMLAGVAHELNNPLAAISGFAQIILRAGRLSSDDRSAVETINHEANRAARIVRDLQAFARERTYSQREAVDLNDVVSYVLAAQRYTMDTHGIRREVRLEPSLPPVRVDRAHLEQVLINLLANASQALQSMVDAPARIADADGEQREPTIIVRTGVNDREVVLEVRDNGPGILPENLPRVFDPFFTTRPEGEGTGLGLAVVHGIVASYDGRLEVESEPGEGSLFRVSIPVIEEAHVAHSTGNAAPTDSRTGRAGAPVSAAPGKAALRQLEILIVEDEDAIQRMLTRYFESRGHTVTTVGDGVAALRHAEQSAYDVVVCDLRLPGVDGFETLRRLREMPTGARCKCILMTGANAKVPAGPLRDALRLSAIVNKPFEIDEMRSAVED
jgi:two-component system NtrC family sensor kinase